MGSQFKQDTVSRKSHPLAGKKIIVCGAGMGGLAFAIALRKLWPTISAPGDGPPTLVIYEREELNQANREGYSMSIRDDGVPALQKLGILDDVLRVSITGNQANAGAFSMWTKEWRSLLKVRPKPVPGLPVSSMRIARKNLRGQLLRSLGNESMIHWGVAAEGTERMTNGSIQVRLSSGERVECDLLVVADGSKSKIRSSLRPDDNLEFTGVVSIAGTAVFPDGSIPAPVDRDWGIGLSGDGHGLFVSPVDKHKALWSISYLASQPREVTPASQETGKALLAEALQRGRSFGEPFPTLAKASDLETISIFNAMDKKPFALEPVEDGSGQIVFLGDASHAVSPYAGNGANLALIDGWDLAEQLCRCESIPEAIRAFNKKMVPRARTVLRFSHIVIFILHARGVVMWLLIQWFALLGYFISG